MRPALLLCAAACAVIACRSERKTPPALDPETAPPAAPTAPTPAPAAAPSTQASNTPARGLPVDMDVSDSQATAIGGSLVNFDVEGAAGRYVFTVMSRGTSCASDDGQKDSIVALKIDGTEAHRWTIDGTRFVERSSAPIGLTGGRHHVSVDFLNDYYAGDNCDRNAWVSHLKIAPEK